MVQKEILVCTSRLKHTVKTMPGSVLEQCLAQHCEYFWISLSLLPSPKLGLRLGHS